MVPDLSRPPPGPHDPRDPATGLTWARATYCLRRALEASPGDSPTIKALAACFGVRRMAEARRRIESLPRRADRPEDTFGSLEGPLGRAEGSTWSETDRIAATFLHLGNPRAARRTWGEATDPPSTALRWTRMAAADLAELDATAAESRCRQALRLDPRLGEAWCLLAVACLEAAHVDEARDACRRALECQLSDAQRERVAGVQARAGLSRADAVR
jgi:Tfp pilus assembly protein PilF